MSINKEKCYRELHDLKSQRNELEKNIKKSISDNKIVDHRHVSFLNEEKKKVEIGILNIYTLLTDDGVA